VTPNVVVDIGNSRMKWGRCNGERVTELVPLPFDDPNTWSLQADQWQTTQPLEWAVGGVHPKRMDQFLEWQHRRGGTCVHFRHYTQLPIRVSVDSPETVGLDRLFGAIAANARRQAGYAALTIDVGTALTLNVVAPDGTFRGGAILPGFRLMAKALHEQTAKLPLVEVGGTNLPPFPGTNTAKSIGCGIRLAIVGAVQQACSELAAEYGSPEQINTFVTGGGSTPNLFHLQNWTFQHLPALNLEGIRIAALALAPPLTSNGNEPLGRFDKSGEIDAG
jgi:type III pantothenate kinase